MITLTARSQALTTFIEPALTRSIFSSKSFSLGKSNLSLGIDGYSTNYWFATIVPYINYAYSIHVDREVPDGYALGRMRSPYRRTFSHPFHRFGDLAAGLSAALDFDDFPIGVYGAVRYKTTEALYNHLPKGHDNDRAHYINPELGLRGNFGNFSVELGASYDAVLSYKGHVHDFDKDAVNSGFNAVAGLGIKLYDEDNDYYYHFLVKYTHPLYNFYNEEFSPDGGVTHPLDGLKYKIGFITTAFRYCF